MGLRSIDTEGNLTWHCPHWPDEAERACGAANSAHINHEQIQWHGMEGAKEQHQMVSLPPCPGCGAQTFLKVHFTARELMAPNMWLEWNSERIAYLAKLQSAYQAETADTPHKAALLYQIKELEAIRDAGGLHTESHATALRHVELARQMKQAGKLPIETEQGVPG